MDVDRREPDGAILSWKEYMIITEQSPLMIWRSDATAAFDYFNGRWLEFTGRTMEEQLGDGWAEGVHPDDFNHCLKIFLDAFRKREEFEMEFRLRRGDGEYRWILDRGVPYCLEDGVFGGYFGSCIDMHEAVLARQALREKREKELSTLQALLPICSHCKKIRDDAGYWSQLESYLKTHIGIDFTHGLCPDCAELIYPQK